MEYSVHELNEVLQDSPDKASIATNAMPEITKSLKRISIYPAEERRGRALGWSFENLVVEEIMESQNQNEQQREASSIIRDLFDNPDMSLGNERARKPDSVTVIFDKLGHLVIKEVVEAKLSFQALQKKLNSQPQESITNIEKIVDLVNEMSETDDFEQLDVVKKLKSSDSFRKKFLKNIYERVKKLKLDQKITFSEKFSYHFVVPTGESTAVPKLDLKIGKHGQERHVTAWASNSRFSVNNCEKIVDHFAET